MEGLGIYKPTEECLISSINSAYISDPLVKLIKRQVFDFSPRQLAEDMKWFRAEVHKAADERYKVKLARVMECRIQ